MSVHYVPTTVLGAKYKREQSNAIHALCQSAFKIFIQFLPLSIFGMERNVPKKLNTSSQIQSILVTKSFLKCLVKVLNIL